MSDLRDNLEHAKQAYKRLRYEGDLADDVFARLDAERAASMRIDQPAKAFNWRPLLAIAAAVAVVATTVVTLTRTGPDRPKDVAIIDVPPVLDVPKPAEAPKATDTTAVVQATEEAADFTVVPSYQSFAISVPTSLSLASVDEYDRQAEEAKQTSTDAAQTTVQ